MLETRAKLPRQVRVGGSVVCGLIDRHLGHGDLTATCADQIGQLGHLDSQLVESKVFETDAPSSDQGGGDHRVEINAAHLNAVILKDGHVVVGVVGALGNALAFEQGTQGLQHVILQKLLAFVVPNRNVPTLVRLV